MRRSVPRPRVLGVAFAAFFVLASNAASPAAQRKVALTYSFAPPRIRAIADRCRVEIARCRRLIRRGEPVVPFRTAKVLLPPGYEVADIQVQPLGPAVDLWATKPLEHGPVPIPLGADGRLRRALIALDKPNPRIYNSDKPYPARLATLVSVQRLRGHNIAIIRLYPIQYLPLRGRLLFRRRLRLELTLRPSDKTTTPDTRPATKALIASLVDNPDALPETQEQPQPTGQTLPGGPYDYLLISSADLLPHFQPLVDQKTADGLRVVTKAMEDIAPNYPANPDPETLRAFIRDAYQSWGIQYVLLGGDASVVPYRGAYGHVAGSAAQRLGDYTDNNIPCDLYYACLDGTWNSDGDDRWGEPTDGPGGSDVDLLAEVFVGRAPVETPQEVQNFVNKLLAYEQTGHPRAFDALFLAESLGDGDQGGDCLDRSLPHFSSYTIEWLDDRSGTTWSGTGDCIPALNRSPHIVAHAGHANWNYVMRLTSSSLDSLTNPSFYIIHSIGCYPGAFDYSDAMAEHFTKRNTHGAIAVLMNSRYGWYAHNYEWAFSGQFQEAFFDNLLSKGNINIGIAHQKAKEDLIAYVEPEDDDDGMVYRWCYYEITLFGDPHMPLKSQANARKLTVRSFDATPSTNDYFTGLPVASDPDPDITTEASVWHNLGSTVTLTAPQTHDGRDFVRWKLDDTDQPDGQTTLQVTMNADHTAVAVYARTVGITVNPTSGLETTEGGGTATFTVVLATQPAADVTVT